jgi:hypothetical protein
MTSHPDGRLVHRLRVRCQKYQAGDRRVSDDPELIEWRGRGPYDWNNTA